MQPISRDIHIVDKFSCIGDEKILGSSRFVEKALAQDEIEIESSSLRLRQGWNLDKLILGVCSLCEVSETRLFAKARANQLARAKSLNCYWGADELGLTLTEIASRLKISQQAVTKWVKQGKAYCEMEKVKFDDLTPKVVKL